MHVIPFSDEEFDELLRTLVQGKDALDKMRSIWWHRESATKKRYASLCSMINKLGEYK